VVPGAPPGSAWGVFGPDDEIGTLNLLTPERVREAVTLVRRGDTFNLDMSLDLPAIPFGGARRRPKHTVLVSADGTSRDEYVDGYFPQYSSQWDGLRHMRHPRHGYYNFATDEEVASIPGRLGIEHVGRHGIVGRGVLLDVARYLDECGAPLDPDVRRELPVSLMEEVAGAQGVEFRQGDILLFRTGLTARIMRQGAQGIRADEGSGEYQGPGLQASTETLAWLWDRHFSAVVADNYAVEAWPPPAGEEYLHYTAIPLLGLTLGELFDLESLAADCAADGIHEFLFIAKPWLLPGGIGSSANAIAMK
jgi:kynurenine formamidase